MIYMHAILSYNLDELDSVVLLNQLAYQLNLTAEYKNSQVIRVPAKT